MFLVTGATGNVGSQVVHQLLSAGHSVRVFTRDAGKVAQWGDRVQLALGDFTQPDTFEAAATGVEGVFMMNGVLDGALFRQLITAAKAQGSPRFVFLSSLFAADPGSPIGQLHKDKEEVLRASGLPVAIVRAGGFMTNAWQWIPTIQAEGVVYNATGQGKIAPVAPEDIAAVAVHALTTPVLTETVFEVTGGSLLTVPEQVSILAKITGKSLRAVDIPVEAAVQGLVRYGVPAQVAAAVGKSYEAIREGRSTTISDTVQRLTGRPPQTFEAWAQEHVSRFV